MLLWHFNKWHCIQYNNVYKLLNYFMKMGVGWIIFTENIYGQDNRPSESTIKQILGRHERNGSLDDQRAEEYRYSYRSQEHIDLVRVSVIEESNISISRRSQQLRAK